MGHDPIWVRGRCWVAMESPQTTQPPDPRRERALAHPLRVRILERLRRRPATPEELAAELEVSVDVIAYHQRVLSRAGCLPPDDASG